MAVTLTKQQALRIIADISAILPRKCRIPVLGHVLFESGEDGSVRVTATDLEQTLTTRIAGASDGDPVRFLLPVSELKSLKSMPTGGTVTFKSVADDSVLCTVSGGDHSFSRTIATMPASEFPETSVDAELAECDLGAFLRVFRATAFAASSDPARVVINSVYADPERQALVATDGRRLTIRPLADFPLPGDAILPLTRMLLKRLPEEANGRIGVHDDENDCQTLVIDTGELIYSCKCPEGIYPNYRQVIPETVGYTASFSFGAAGLEAMESLRPHLDKSAESSLCIFGRGERVAVGVESESAGRTTLVLPECRFEGEASDLAINGEFLLEALKNGFTEMRARPEHAPLLFDDGAEGLHVLMPLRDALSTEMRKAAEAKLEEAGGTPAQPTPIAQPTPEEEDPMNETTTETPEQKNTAPAATPPHALQIVESQDPVARLEELATESQEAIRQAQTAVRELRKQVRAVKAHYRDRERRLVTREKEMERSMSLIQRLQETIAA